MTRHCGHTLSESWWEYDARGIPLVRVCSRCQVERLKTYRPEVLHNPNYEADEAIEADDWDRGVYASDWGPEGGL